MSKNIRSPVDTTGLHDHIFTLIPVKMIFYGGYLWLFLFIVPLTINMNMLLNKTEIYSIKGIERNNQIESNIEYLRIKIGCKISLCLNFVFHLLDYNYHLYESSFTYLGLPASGIAWRLHSSICLLFIIHNDCKIYIIICTRSFSTVSQSYRIDLGSLIDLLL